VTDSVVRLVDEVIDTFFARLATRRNSEATR
jgi:hypothetical protein